MDNLQAIFGAFIVIVIGAALLTSTANTTTGVTQNYNVANESVSFTNGQTATVKNGIVTSITSIVNASNASQVQGSTNYTLTQPKSIAWSGPTGTYNVTYAYNQVSDATSITLVNFNTLFFALAVFFVFLAALSPTFREWIGEHIRR